MHKIVNFMVDESLAAYFCQKLAENGFKNKEAEIRDLLAHSESANPFSRQETDLLIKAIDDCKIIDPACGSSAFPMGILNKLVHVLHKLDPNSGK